MKQYIDKSTLAAEIERLRKNNEQEEDKYYAQFELDVACGYDMALDDVEKLLNTLKVKEVQEEPVNRTPADIEAAMQEVEEKSRAFTEAHEGEDADTILAQMLSEEPVSKGLVQTSADYARERLSYDDYPAYNDEYELMLAYEAGAMWQKANLWKPADEDLPEIDKEVIVLVGIKNPVTTDSVWGSEVAFAHRPNPDGWNGKSITTGEVEHYEAQTYDKGGWNIPDVKFWLDCELPKMEE